jgi:urea transport system permease protein
MTVTQAKNPGRGRTLPTQILGVIAMLVLMVIGRGVEAQDLPARPATDLAATLAELASADFSRKNEIVQQLVALGHTSTREILTAFLEDRLVATAAADDGVARKIVIVAPGQDESLAEVAVLDPVTLEAAGTGPRTGFERITTNNGLRRALRGAIAQFSLSSPDAAIRVTAVKEMLRSIDDDGIALLRDRLAMETDKAVRKQINLALAMADLTNADAAVRLAAVTTLSGELNPDIYNRLKLLTEAAEDGSFAEPDQAVRLAAGAAVRSIEASRSFYGVLENLFFGLSLGSVLVLSAIGLAITFGVMGVINMAHGEVMMLGAYTTYVIQLLMPNHIGASIIVAIPAAFLVGGLAGVAIERGVVRFLYGRPLETLLATFGISLILQQLVRSIFSPNNRAVETPAWLSGSLSFNDAFSITYNRLYIVIFTLMVFALLQLVLKKTSLGLKVRAVAQNRAMAKAMGVRTEWIDAMTFGLGSGVAGVAGVALSQLTNVGPNLGQSYIIDSFMVVVFGGVGNLWGTLISGMSLGAASKFLEPWAGAVLAKILVLVFLILFIQRKPRGLFPQKGRAAEH